MLKTSWAGFIIYLQVRGRDKYVYPLYMVITVLENATRTDEVPFTDSTFLSQYLSMVNLLMTIYFGHTDAKWTVCIWEQSTCNRCCPECRSCIYDKSVNHRHIQIGILFVFTFISSLRGHMLCQQNITFCTNISIYAGNQM